MSETERVINDLNVAKHILCNPQILTFEMNIRIGQAITNALALLKEQEPREITKDEWESWKKDKHRDPLCMYWRGDITPFWILRPEEVHEPAYLIGDIKIFKGKPDKEKMYEIWEQDNGKQNVN